VKRAELLALCWENVTVSLPVGGRAFGLGRTGAYAAYHRGEFPVHVLKIGTRLVVSTADILVACGLSLADQESADKPLTCDDTAPDHITVTPRPSLAAVESAR